MHLPLDPQYACQISARLQHAYTSYSDFCKVCEMTKKKKKKKMKKFLRNFVDSYLGNGLRDLVKIWNITSPCHLGKALQSYRCVKIATLLFLSIYSLRLRTPRILGSHDTLLCVLIYFNAHISKLMVCTCTKRPLLKVTMI